MSNILEKAFWCLQPYVKYPGKGLLMPTAFSKLFAVGKCEKKIAKNPIWRLWIKAELILITMFRPTYMPNLVTLAWKMSSGMSNEASSLNGQLCAYLMRQNLRKWSVKNYGCESVNGDFPCAKLENAKKNRQKLCKNPELILITMLSPTFVPNLVTLAWKMNSGMPKEAGSLNGPLCAYLMRQNLHDRTCPRS